MNTGVRIIVTGRVQGVWYRASCEREANRLGVAGTVRNRSDGSVEVVAEGDEAAITSLTEWCRVGSTNARVQSIEVHDEEPTGESSFRIVE